MAEFGLLGNSFALVGIDFAKGITVIWNWDFLCFKVSAHKKSAVLVPLCLKHVRYCIVDNFGEEAVIGKGLAFDPLALTQHLCLGSIHLPLVLDNWCSVDWLIKLDCACFVLGKNDLLGWEFWLFAEAETGINFGTDCNFHWITSFRQLNYEKGTSDP